jgi:hypothetical protein
MKRTVLSLGLVVVLLVLASVASAGERWVFVPSDQTPFTVNQTDFVRIVGNTVSGGNITAEITGPAKIVGEDAITMVVQGQVPIGAMTKEFLIQPTGTGEVTVTLTMTYPMPGEEPKTTTYRFTVK